LSLLGFLKTFLKTGVFKTNFRDYTRADTVLMAFSHHILNVWLSLYSASSQEMVPQMRCSSYMMSNIKVIKFSHK